MCSKHLPAPWLNWNATKAPRCPPPRSFFCHSSNVSAGFSRSCRTSYWTCVAPRYMPKPPQTIDTRPAVQNKQVESNHMHWLELSPQCTQDTFPHTRHAFASSLPPPTWMFEGKLKWRLIQCIPVAGKRQWTHYLPRFINHSYWDTLSLVVPLSTPCNQHNVPAFISRHGGGVRRMWNKRWLTEVEVCSQICCDWMITMIPYLTGRASCLVIYICNTVAFCQFRQIHDIFLVDQEMCCQSVGSWVMMTWILTTSIFHGWVSTCLKKDGSAKHLTQWKLSKAHDSCAHFKLQKQTITTV